MLEKLNTINWPRLSSCYGSAEDIPKAIHDLTSDDGRIRRKAYGTLRSELEHQGSVFQASEYAVPFLLEILSQSQIHDKCELIRLLAYLGCKGNYLNEFFLPLEQRLLLEGTRQEDIKQNKDPALSLTQKHRLMSEKTHQAVRKGLPLFLELFNDPDPVLRMEVTYLLACFKEDHSQLIPAILSRLQVETDERVLPCLLLCLGRICSPTQEIAILLLHYLHDKELIYTQFAASIALCSIFQNETPERAVRFLLHVLASPFPLPGPYDKLPDSWRSDCAHAHAIFYLDQLISSPHKDLIIKRLVELFPVLDSQLELACADLLLRAAFVEKGFHIQQRTTFETLDSLQQTILHLLAAKETLWSQDIGIDDEFLSKNFPNSPTSFWTLKYLGLPSTLPKLQAFIKNAG